MKRQMIRLTHRNKLDPGFVWSIARRNRLIKALAEYEDTGLSPEQLRQIDTEYQKLATELAEIKKNRPSDTYDLLADLEYHADVYQYGKEHTDVNAISTVNVLRAAIRHIKGEVK